MTGGNTMEIHTNTLNRLLNMTRRTQTVAGKPQDQVIATMLRFGDDACSTTSLVRDGKTSVSHFRVAATGEGAIPIPDIDRLQGVLKFHGNNVTMSLNGNKLLVKSGSKQTTLLADEGGLAFPHSTDTIGEWESKSSALAGQIDPVKGYTMRDGTTRAPFWTWTVNATELFEAFRCDQMNGQKLNRYTLTFDGANIAVATGDELKGQTSTEWETLYMGAEPWEATFEGGLENVLKHLDGDITLRLIDFRPEGQGIRLILDADTSGWVFQASVLR